MRINGKMDGWLDGAISENNRMNGEVASRSADSF